MHRYNMFKRVLNVLKYRLVLFLVHFSDVSGVRFFFGTDHQKMQIYSNIINISISSIYKYINIININISIYFNIINICFFSQDPCDATEVVVVRDSIDGQAGKIPDEGFSICFNMVFHMFIAGKVNSKC